jgi:acetyl-CoA synthetase
LSPLQEQDHRHVRYPQISPGRCRPPGCTLTPDDYRRLYRQSVEDPDTFWAEQAKRLDWIKPWSSVQQCDLKTGKARWFDGGQLNVSYNCIDRHLAQRGEQTALLWEGDDPADSAITYRELHRTSAAWPMC